MSRYLKKSAFSTTISSMVPQLLQHDPVDDLLDDWARERPDLDATGLAVIHRIWLLSKHLRERDKRVLARFGLAPWEYEVLAALRRQGTPYALSPTALRRLVLLSSGAMTTRLDRLEERGFVQRSHSSEDRRGIIVTLTPEGRDLADRALEGRLEEVERVLSNLRADDRNTTAALLRVLLLTVSGDSV